MKMANKTLKTMTNSDGTKGTNEFFCSTLASYKGFANMHTLAGEAYVQGIPENISMKPFSGSYKELAAHPGRALTLKWDSTQGEGTQLGSVLCGALTTSNAFPTNMDALAVAFSQYRGDFRITIDPVCTTFHQGTLWICFVPGPSVVPTYEQALGLDGVTFVLHNATRQHIDIPYQTFEPWLGTDNYSESMGTLYFFVNNPLQTSNGNVASSVDLNIWKSLQNAEFKFPKFSFQARWNYVAPDGTYVPKNCEDGSIIDTRTDDESFELQSGNELGNEEVQSEVCSTAHSTEKPGGLDNTLGVVEDNMYKVLKRGYPIPRDGTTTSFGCPSDMLQHHKNFFFANSGSKEYILQYQNPTGVAYVSGQNDTVTASNSSTVGTANRLAPRLLIAGVGGPVGVVVPRQTRNPLSIDNRLLAPGVAIEGPVTGGVAYDAAADDLRFYMMRPLAPLLPAVVPPPRKMRPAARVTPLDSGNVDLQSDGANDPEAREGPVDQKSEKDIKFAPMLARTTKNIPVRTKEISENAYPVAGFTWAGTAAVGTRLATIGISAAVNNANFPIHGVSAYQKLRRFDTIVTVKMASTAFYQGRAVVVYNPTNEDLGGAINTICNALHVEIPVDGITETFEFKVPFFSETYSDPVGSIDIYVFNELQGIDQLNGKVFFKHENVEFAIRQPQTLSRVAPLIHGVKHMELAEEDVRQESDVESHEETKSETACTSERRFRRKELNKDAPDYEAVLTTKKEHSRRPKKSRRKRKDFVYQEPDSEGGKHAPPSVAERWSVEALCGEVQELQEEDVVLQSDDGNAITRVKEICDRDPNTRVEFHAYTCQGGDHDPTWRCRAIYHYKTDRVTVNGKGFSKKAARQDVCRTILGMISDEEHLSWRTDFRHRTACCTERYHSRSVDSVVARQQLALAGDVESNPGPASWSQFSDGVPTSGEDPQEERSFLKQMFSFLGRLASGAMSAAGGFMNYLVGTAKEFGDKCADKILDWGLDMLTGAFRAKYQRYLELGFRIFKFAVIGAYVVKMVHSLFTGASFASLTLDLLVLSFIPEVKDTFSEQIGKLASSLFVSQAKGEEEDWRAPLVSVVGTLGMAAFGMHKSEQRSVTSMLMMTLARPAVSDAYKLVKEGVTHVLKWIMGPKEEDKPALQELEDLGQRIQTTLVKFYEYKAQGAFTSMNTGSVDIESGQMLAFMVKTKSLAVKLHELLTITNTQRELWRFVKDVDDVWNLIKKSRLATIPRMEPVGICLRGDSGVGKSLLTTTTLPEHILLASGLVETRQQASEQIYSMPTDPNQKFFDGYIGQLFAIFDDFGSASDGSDYTQFLQFISSASAPLNMAGLEDKGTTFCSPFCAVTTNQPTFRSKALNNTDALQRRFPVDYSVAVLPEFRKGGRLDYPKLTKEMEKCTKVSEEIDLYDRVWQFEVRAAGLTEKRCTYSQVLGEIVDEYEKKCENLAANKTARFGLTNDLPPKDADRKHIINTRIAVDRLEERYFDCDVELQAAESLCTMCKQLVHDETGRVVTTKEQHKCFSDGEPFICHECETIGPCKHMPICEDCEHYRYFDGRCQCDMDRDQVEQCKPEVCISWTTMWKEFTNNQKSVEEMRKHEAFARKFTVFESGIPVDDYDAVKTAVAYIAFIHQGKDEVIKALKIAPGDYAKRIGSMFEYVLRSWKFDFVALARFTKATLREDIARTRDFGNQFLKLIKAEGYTAEQLATLAFVHHTIMETRWLGNPEYSGPQRETYHLYIGPTEEYLDLHDFVGEGIRRNKAFKNRMHIIHRYFHMAMEFTPSSYLFVDHFLFIYRVLFKANFTMMEPDGVLWGFKLVLRQIIITIGWWFVFRTLFAVINYFYGFSLESKYSSDQRLHASRRGVRRVDGGKIQLQGGVQPTEFIKNMRNFVKIWSRDVEVDPEDLVDTDPSAYGFMVDGTHMVSVTHVLQREHVYVELLAQYTGIPTKIAPVYTELKNFGKLPDAVDASLVRLPFAQWKVRSVLRQFITEDDYVTSLGGYQKAIWFLGSYHGLTDMPCVHSSTVSFVKKGIRIGGVEVTSEADTKAGHCGTPYTLDGRYIGIHCAKNNITNGIVFAPVTREALVDAMDVLATVIPPTQHVEVEPIQVDEQCYIPNWKGDEEGFEVLGGCVDKDFKPISIYSKMDTAFVPSAIADKDLWPDGHAPSAKSRPILLREAQKYNFTHEHEPPTVEENNYVLSYFGEVFSRRPNRSTRIFTDAEILNGNEDVCPMMRDSSAGFWSLVSQPGKSEFIEVEYDEGTGERIQSWSQGYYDTKHPMYDMSLYDYLKSYEGKARKGVRSGMAPIWISTLKDELRKEAKVEAGLTRVFEAAPVDLTVLVKKYFGAFAEFYRTNPGIVLGHAIGTDKVRDWAAIYEMLKSRGKTHGIDLDYTKFDSTIPPAFYQFFEQVIGLYYHDATEEEKNIRAVLIQEMQHSYQYIDGKIVLSHKGNKSGMYLTDVLNSLANVWVLMIAFFRIHNILFGTHATIEMWAKLVALFTYGDDGTMSVDNDALRWYNAKNIGVVLHAIGFRATAADKTELKAEARPIEDLDFLKSGFVPRDGVVACPMPMQTSYREMNWIRKKHAGNYTVMKGMWNDALRFASWHGPETFNEFKCQIVKKIRESDIPNEMILGLLDYNTCHIDMYVKQHDLRNSCARTGVLPPIYRSLNNF